MIINKSTAGHFYGRRPPLAGQLPAHYGGSSSVLTDYRIARDLGNVGESVGKLYMPGSAGAKAVGGVMDKFASVGMGVIKTTFPTLGQVLSFVGDALDFVLAPIGNLLEAMAIGACTYLEEKQAMAILSDMENNKVDYIVAAFKDTLYAFYRRIGTTNNKVLDIKEGRDPLIQGALGTALDALGIDRNANRVANRIYSKAVAAGAKDWQAAAAVSYGVTTGFLTKGFPAGFDFKVKGISIAKVGGGSDTQKAMFPLGNDFDAAYFAKLGSPVKHDVAWIDAQYKAKSGGAIGDTKNASDGGGGGGIVPILAIAAAAFLASR